MKLPTVLVRRSSLVARFAHPTRLAIIGAGAASVLAFTLVGAGCGKKKSADEESGSSDKKKSKPDDDSPGEKKKSKKDDDTTADVPTEAKKLKKSGDSVDGCKLPEDHVIKSDWTLTKGCELLVDSNLTVVEGATLTIEEGVKLTMGDGAAIEVGYGRLVAKGTDERPIKLTSANKTPDKGDWTGIVFEAKSMNGNLLDHVKIEYAGKKSAWGEGVVVVDGAMGGKRLSMTHVTVTKSRGDIVSVSDESSSFLKFEHNTIKGNDGMAMRIPANIVGTIGAGNVLDAAVHLTGNIHVSQVWPKLDVPFVFDDNCEVSSEKEALSIAFPEGATIKFLAGVVVVFGEGGGSGFTAKNVKFTSASPTPAPADWSGFVFRAKTTTTTIDGCVFEYAGKASAWGAGALNFSGTTVKKVKGFTMKGTSFKQIDDPAIRSDDDDCGVLDDAASGNTIDKGKICGKET